MLGHAALTPPADSLQLCLALNTCLCKAPRQPQQEIMAFSVLSCACRELLPCMQTSGSPVLRETFQSPHGHLIPQFFLLNFWPISCLLQLDHLRQLQCLTTIADCCPNKTKQKTGERLFILTELLVRSMSMRWGGGIQGNDRSNNNNSMG